MRGVEFRAALDALDALLASDAPDATATSAAFRQLRDHRPPAPSADDLRRMFAHCYAALDHWPYTQKIRTVPDEGFRMYWQCVGLIEATFTDDAARNRDFMQSSVDRYLAYGLRHGDDPPRPAPPRVYAPLDVQEAKALAAPYLAMLEEAIAEQPYSHLKLAWEVFRRPVMPFDQVFEQWLEDLDARGVSTGDSLPALRTAQALSALAQEGRQHLHWETVEAEVLPKLEDPHPMVAACAGRFIGMLMSQGGERIVRSTPPALSDFLASLTQVQNCRRAVAGGFVQGFDGFGELAAEAGEDFDLDAWVLAILDHPLKEPYVPGAQAFWFYVHEHFARRPDFIAGLIDAGHEWIALMCATELEYVEGMAPVLERLAASEHEGIAKSAGLCLVRGYKDG